MHRKRSGDRNIGTGRIRGVGFEPYGGMMDEQGQADGEQINEDELEDVNGGFNMYATLQKALRTKADTATDGASQAQSSK